MPPSQVILFLRLAQGHSLLGNSAVPRMQVFWFRLSSFHGPYSKFQHQQAIAFFPAKRPPQIVDQLCWSLWPVVTTAVTWNCVEITQMPTWFSFIFLNFSWFVLFKNSTEAEVIVLHEILLNSRNSKSRTNHVDLTILERTAIPKRKSLLLKIQM